MVLLGCKPKGRHTEQHDVYFGIGDSLENLVPEIIQSWPEAQGKLHVDAWREINFINGFAIKIINKRGNEKNKKDKMNKLFFINLGGYKLNEFEEYHYKILLACENKSIAIRQAKETAFYKHTGFAGAVSHIDDNYGIDVDDIYELEDILPNKIKQEYSIIISPAENNTEDKLHIGYLMLEKI